MSAKKEKLEKLNNKSYSYCHMDDFDGYCNYLDKGRAQRKNYRKGFYKDPDTTHSDPKSTFYIKLLLFLNKHDPVWEYEYKGKGHISIKNQKEIKLISDQLGFSAPKYKENNIKQGKNPEIGWDERYIYALFLNRDSYIKEDSVMVANIIENTRSLGGSFLWPKAKVGKKTISQFNINRGVGKYIKDRADLTLLEIKKFYELYKKYNKSIIDKMDMSEKEEKEILDKIKKEMKEYILFQGKNDSIYIFKWLKHFNTFENYIDFFFLNDFISNKNGEYNIINLMTGKSFSKEELDELDYIRSPKKYKQKHKCTTKNIELKFNNYEDIKKIENILININNLVVRRSNRMENDIQNEYKKWLEHNSKE